MGRKTGTGVYKNALEEIKLAEAEDDSDKEHQEDDTVDLDYEFCKAG